MILIVASNRDIASKNIKEEILKYYRFDDLGEDFQGHPTYTAKVDEKDVRLVTLKVDCLQAQMITKSFHNLELIVFISRHSSKSGTPTLSVHTPGNLGKAKLGGIANKVSISPANSMRDALRVMMQLREEMMLNYQVSYECTHHGPSLEVPTMFTELGSSEEQWKDEKAAEVIAHATMNAVSNFNNFSVDAVIGIGGPHYNGKFTRIALEDGLAFGHMIPKYVIPHVDLEMIKQCIDRTLEEVRLVVLDWKGIRGKDKQMITELIKKTDIPFMKAKDLR
ncbi:MAG: D-aminoacyl-tRNA deacylase [Candidatus Bathyarchaeota archaeon]|jgi:D-aminoacyl-tRNA deacylase